MQQYLQNKKGLVQNVFDQVYDQYDLMNDFMSLGCSSIVEKKFVKHDESIVRIKNLIDVACGTGDVAKIFSGHY